MTNPLHFDPQRDLRQRNGRPDLSLSVLYVGSYESGAEIVRAEERQEMLLCVHLSGEVRSAPLAVLDRMDLDSARRRQQNPEQS